MWLLLKQQANKQWVKTLSTHSKLACWWVILYSEKKHLVSLSLLEDKKAKAAQPKELLDWSSATLHRIKSFGLKARCRGARPTALVHSL